MRYGFIIDQDRCIGCHACTVACKEEHQVPLGVFRTWVKYVEKGEFPNSSRHFGVMRCNHCDNAPCIEICPTSALFRRSNGIVDFDNEICIGCKGCMQACPYDALYIDPNNNTAAKCNFCAHRVEANQEPACVIVCPTQAIIAGDLDDKTSKASRIVATDKVSVRKPEKQTQPKLYYIGIEEGLLDPTLLSRQNTHMFAERRDEHAGVGGFDARATREVYDVAHPAPWGWKIAAYLWTKSIAAGVLLIAAILMGWTGENSALVSVVSPLIALAALGVTMVLLVIDLKRPDRFYYLLTKGNFRSWLVLGAYVLMAYGAAATAWLLFGLLKPSVPMPLVWITAALGIASACYSAFLFAQAKGRDLWQSPLFLWHLLAQALVAGAATLLLVSFLIGAAPGMIRPLLLLLAGSLTAGAALTLIEITMSHPGHANLAIQNMVRGKMRGSFWISVVGIGMVAPIIVLAIMLATGVTTLLGLIAAVLALMGLWYFEDMWVKAGQSVPLS